MKLLLAFVLTLCFIFFLANPALAVSVTISEIPGSVGSDPFEFKAKVEGAQSGTNYLRVSFSEPGKFNYFGYTFNGTDFYNGSEITKYLPITIDSSGKWEGTVKTKIDPGDSSFKGSGNYMVKVRRYTQSGSSYIWSNEVSLSVNSPSSPTPSSSTPAPTYTSSIASSIFVVENVPTSVSSNQNFSVKVNFVNLNAKNTKFFIKGAFVKKGESNYFGFTKVNGSLVKNSSSYSSQREITTDANGQWVGDLEVQPDSNDSGFKGTGEYGFKVGRYTQSGSGPTWSNESTITINAVSSPAVSETKSSTPASSPGETSGSILGTEENNFEDSIVGSPEKEVKKNIKIPEIKGALTKKEESKVDDDKSKALGYNFIYMIIGFIILISSVGLFVYKVKKQGGLRKIDI